MSFVMLLSATNAYLCALFITLYAIYQDVLYIAVAASMFVVIAFRLFSLERQMLLQNKKKELV